MNYPAIRMNIDRVHAAELGLTQKDIVDNVITALNSNTMIAPNYWVDYKTGNDYFLTVQYAEHGKDAIHNLIDLKQIPLRAPNLKQPTTLDTVVKLVNLMSPTEVDHYQIQRVVDVYVTPKGEDLGKLRTGHSADHRGRETAFQYPGQLCAAWSRHGRSLSRASRIGFILSFVLLFLILVAQFRSFIDPFLIMLAIPMGFIGVLMILPLTHTTLNVMSLMGVLMLIGIAGSNSILIVDFAHKLEEQGSAGAGCGDHGVPRAPAADSDDFAGDDHRHDPDGDEAGRRRRTICADGARHHRRPDFVRAAHGVHRSGGLFAGLRQKGKKCFQETTGATLFGFSLPIALGAAYCCMAQAPPALTLQQAEALAIQNHPQIQAAQNEVNYANQQIIENRSAFYPTITGNVTGTQAQSLSRLGAGDLSASRLFDRESNGIIIKQLITDSGRTSNLVASSRLQAQATQQASTATRYDVILQVNRAYFNALHDQASGKSCPANSQRTPVAERPGYRTCQKRIEVATRRELCRSQRLPGKTVAAARSGCSAAVAGGTGPRSWGRTSPRIISLPMSLFRRGRLRQLTS